jgi:hypothetical protein
MMDLTKANIQTYAARCDTERTANDKAVEDEMKHALTTQRFLTKSQFCENRYVEIASPKEAL